MARHYSSKESKAGHKYNMSPKHRKAESKGMKRYYSESKDMKRHNADMHEYADSESSKKGKEYYGMGYGQPSNLPQEPIQHPYPAPYPRLKEDYPDTIGEIDRDLIDSFQKTEAYPSDSMY